ncbi:DUF3137 domain-containing protein [Peloplasma aerotolerans]|uniref:DUF3137 domain-containing protein n=1 Tax=Peloplasma aerotolerans TaxID=3044389 RepID=A0AAW6U478_9MOLU|nr:DUF3137 domain-containing protein [Mariniplasma sp. M4Ah]MDI6452717.1 DUF3137 domain-containing protein [Mariniplasma sp. M4Ah]MDR4968173.1 DUF3137 domain-containing protein [Acholeplasmataceae bacterium]
MNLEQIKRKKAIYETWFIIFIIITALSFILFMTNPLLMIGFIIGGLGASAMTGMLKKLSNHFKNVYVREVLDKLIPGCKYEPERGLESSYVYDSKILKREDRYHSEDYLEGYISGKHFISADVHLRDVRRSGKSTTVVTVFQGRFFEIEFNKKFENDVYIMPNRTLLFGLFEGMKRVELEYIVFNQTFDVFSKDQHSAFYLLKPRFMEKLLEFSNIAKRTMFGFRAKKVMIALDTRVDSFDLKMFKDIDTQFFDEIKKEVKLIEDLIELIS